MKMFLMSLVLMASLSANAAKVTGFGSIDFADKSEQTELTVEVTTGLFGDGTLSIAGKSFDVQSASLSGNEFRATAFLGYTNPAGDRVRLVGTLNGSAIEGEARFVELFYVGKNRETRERVLAVAPFRLNLEDATVSTSSSKPKKRCWLDPSTKTRKCETVKESKTLAANKKKKCWLDPQTKTRKCEVVKEALAAL